MAVHKNTHMTISDRQIIEIGIRNGSTKTAIARTVGKDKSTIGKEISLHRILFHKSTYPIDCAFYRTCKDKYSDICSVKCSDYSAFYCPRRDRSPGACNGCDTFNSCRRDKYLYKASHAEHEYRETLVNSRIGVNATVNQIKELGLLIKPLIDQGQSVYAILQNHPEITLTEKTIYNYIENGVFQDAGVSIKPIDLQRQARRKIPKNKKIEYSPRKDRSYLKGRTYDDFESFINDYPDTSVVQMDTVYNDVSNGPFIQTFKFMRYDLFFCIYQEVKDTRHMRNGILLLEEILGERLFEKEVAVILTDRGSEFTFADETELREDGTRRTRIFYCDPMASGQKGSVENVHLLLREICPNECDLYALGFTSQSAANVISSHINSYPKEKLNGKSSFQLLEFLSPDMAKKFFDFGLTAISPDQIILKPYLLKTSF